MSEAIFVIPGPLDTPSGSYIYDRRVMELMPSFGVHAHHMRLDGSFPNPSQDDLQAAFELLLGSSSDAKLVIDGLALGVLPARILGKLGSRVIALIHMPLAAKSELSQERREALAKSERDALSFANRVIATSEHARASLIDGYAVPAERITVAAPGTDPAPRASGTGTPLQLLSVGAVTAYSGYEVLVEALTPLEPFDWRLTIVGALDTEPAAVTALENKIAEAGLKDRITLAGAVVPATLDRHYESADIFVTPTRIEGYAMALSEAMVRGITIVATNERARSRTIPEGAVLKVPADDVAALQDALLRVLDSKKLRVKLADAAWEAGRVLPTWNETARRVAAVIMGMQV